MTSKTLTTRKPLVRSLGMGGRIEREMAQPVYALNGQLVVHRKGKFLAVRVIDAQTCEVDILAKPVAMRPAGFGRLQAAEAIVALGGKPFEPKAQPAPAKAAKPAKQAAPAKAAKAAKAAVASTASAVIAAILASDVDADEKIRLIAAANAAA